MGVQVSGKRDWLFRIEMWQALHILPIVQSSAHNTPHDLFDLILDYEGL